MNSQDTQDDFATKKILESNLENDVDLSDGVEWGLKTTSRFHNLCFKSLVLEPETHNI